MRNQDNRNQRKRGRRMNSNFKWTREVTIMKTSSEDLRFIRTRCHMLLFAPVAALRSTTQLTQRAHAHTANRMYHVSAHVTS